MSGVKINVGTIEMSSKDSANNAFRKPPNEKRIEVNKTTKKVNDQFTTTNSAKNN